MGGGGKGARFWVLLVFLALFALGALASCGLLLLTVTRH